MLYMCASDLESECGFATEDLNEIMYGYTAGNLNVIVQTGGTAEWQNTVVADDRCQRYRVTEDGLELVDDSLGMQNMADSATPASSLSLSSRHSTALKWTPPVPQPWRPVAGQSIGLGEPPPSCPGWMNLS